MLLSSSKSEQVVSKLSGGNCSGWAWTDGGAADMHPPPPAPAASPALQASPFTGMAVPAAAATTYPAPTSCSSSASGGSTATQLADSATSSPSCSPAPSSPGPLCLGHSVLTLPPADVVAIPGGGGYLVVRRRLPSGSSGWRDTAWTRAEPYGMAPHPHPHPVACSASSPAVTHAATQAAGAPLEAAALASGWVWSPRCEARYQAQLLKLRLAVRLVLRRRLLQQRRAAALAAPAAAAAPISSNPPLGLLSVRWEVPSLTQPAA